MPDAAVRSLVEHLSDIVPDMPGMNGEAHTVATFAGTWASKLQIPAQPVAAQRLYRLGTLRLPEDVPGRLRRAGSYDVPRLITWDEAFVTETGVSRPPSGDRAALITQRVTEGMFWLWEVADEPVSMAFASPPLAGASRIGAVYTPPARRGNGYANASVGAISAHLLASGVDCLLYTQLVNPISSRIYQRLGYEPTAEILVYRFGPA
jgi:predicted GNAT family acetyltransferase